MSLIEFDVERSDWMRRPGRNAALKIGPFGFYADTADEWRFGFSITVRRWSWSWTVGRDD